MESQNHYYGHSSALAAYCGLPRPRHIAGLVQHGWASVSPVGTHFRDFPSLSTAGGRGWPTGRRRLFVWSHQSRAWSPDGQVETVPIGAPWLYLTAVADAGERPPQRRPEDRTVIMPVHGIETQRIRGDHAEVARHWAEVEGPATVCLYAADARDPEILTAYRGAGHRCVVLGSRMDPAFLGRLWTMLARADRVVSNRLSTPVLYAAQLGRDVAVYGDPLHLDGEDTSAYDRVRKLWPELHGQHLEAGVVRPLAADELGAAHLRSPQELRAVLGWTGPGGPGPFLDYWALAPLNRTVLNVTRRRSATAAATAAPAPAQQGLSTREWFVGALSYLPRRLPRTVPVPHQEPMPVDEVVRG
ncbi:hypothetical protein [Modestobacter sp. SYSU DS0875]